MGLGAEKISVEATYPRGQVTPLYVGLLRAVAALVGVQAKVGGRQGARADDVST